MSSLEDTVRNVVDDFIKNNMLFTALDVSNAVKQSLPLARHREVRDVVRSIFATDIESKGWARTPIVVTLSDGSTAEALLYHDLADSWDLDNKYSAQQRSATSHKTISVVSAPPVVTLPPVSAPAPAPAPAPATTPRAMWDNLFKSQPSLFPKK